MDSRNHPRFCPGAITAGILTLLLLCTAFFCGCLDVEPEEMPPLAASSVITLTTTPAMPANALENTPGIPPVVIITSPKLTKIYTEQNFPAEVKGAVSDFTAGKTTDSVNGFLRWESVKAKTSQPDKVRIQEQIHRIDYALFNTTLKENIRIYIGLTGEQAKRIRNETVFSDNGYAIASYDPSVVYHRLASSGRDNEGYLTMCVIDFRKGNHLLFTNATEREFLLPHGMIWDVDREITYEKLEFSADSIPHYDDIIPTKVRLITTKEHP